MWFIKRMLAVMLFAVALCPLASAEVPYHTYNYQHDFTTVKTPHAYVPDKIYGPGDFGGLPLKNPEDIFVDSQKNTYISDTGNNRILRLKPDFSVDKIIDSFDYHQRTEHFNAPNGLFVTAAGDIYIADMGNGRVVGLDREGAFKRMLLRPETDLIDQAIPFEPIAVAADKFSRLYVVAKGINMGIIVYDENDKFSGFIGSQRVSFNALDYFWKRFMTNDQKDRMQSFIPCEYSNLLSDGDGFIYGVSSSLDENDLASTIVSKNKDGRVSPIKKLNPKGFDILRRNGYFPPVGDVDFDFDDLGKPELSAIIDVALGESGTYSLLDHSKGRIFTYTQNGELLFVFGGISNQVGNSMNPVAIDYAGSNLLVLDSVLSSITIYKRTEYGTLLISAEDKYSTYRYDEALLDWERILEFNPNYALAYDGVGNSLLKLGQYKEAMKYYEYSGNTEQYSAAFGECRAVTVKRWLPLILVVIALLVFAVFKLVRYIGKCNKVKYKHAKHPLWYELTYSFHIMFHPFDGFWDLKHESRGSFKAANIIIAMSFVAAILQKIMLAYVVNAQYGTDADLFQLFFSTVGAALLFVVANWCLTSLMDGKAGIKDIYIAVAYAMMPLFILKLITIPISYVIILEEGMYIAFLNSLAVIWMLFLVFTGVMTTQQYSLAKNTATCAFSVIGMGIIIFILMLFITTVMKIGSFGQILLTEFTRAGG